MLVVTGEERGGSYDFCAKEHAVDVKTPGQKHTDSQCLLLASIALMTIDMTKLNTVQAFTSRMSDISRMTAAIKTCGDVRCAIKFRATR